MSNWDKDRYNSLIARTSFDGSFYKGHYQDCSKNRLAMTAVGKPSWTMVGGLPCLVQRAAGDRVTSGNIASPISCVAPFFVEHLGSNRQSEAVLSYLNASNADVAGGWYLGYNATAACMVLYTRTAAGGLARFTNTPIGGMGNGRLCHTVMYIDTVGLSGSSWVNGFPVVTTFTNAGIPADDAGISLVALGRAVNQSAAMIERAWQGTPSNADVAALYGAAHSLTGGEV